MYKKSVITLEKSGLLVLQKTILLTASVWIGWTANSIAAIKLDISGRNKEHILKQNKVCAI
jgi:hypothetical protein